MPNSPWVCRWGKGKQVGNFCPENFFDFKNNTETKPILLTIEIGDINGNEILDVSTESTNIQSFKDLECLSYIANSLNPFT